MDHLKVKTKYQVTLPTEARTILGVKEGDILGVEVHAGQIVLTPKLLVDKHLTEGMQDLAQGKIVGPFYSADEVVASLKSKR